MGLRLYLTLLSQFLNGEQVLLGFLEVGIRHGDPLAPFLCLVDVFRSIEHVLYRGISDRLLDW